MCFDQQKVVHFSMLSTLFQALVLLLIEYWVLSYSSFLLSHEGEVKISTSLSPTIQDLIDMKLWRVKNAVAKLLPPATLVSAT